MDSLRSPHRESRRLEMRRGGWVQTFQWCHGKPAPDWAPAAGRSPPAPWCSPQSRGCRPVHADEAVAQWSQRLQPRACWAAHQESCRSTNTPECTWTHKDSFKHTCKTWQHKTWRGSNFSSNCYWGVEKVCSSKLTKLCYYFMFPLFSSVFYKGRLGTKMWIRLKF